MVDEQDAIAPPSATATNVESKAQTRPWQKILWARQPYADNYVPPNFLGELRTEPSSSLPSLRTLMLWSLPLSQHLCITLIFVGLFLHLRDGLIPPETLAASSALAIVLCGATMPVSDVHNDDPTWRLDVTQTVLSQKKPSQRRALAQPLSYALLGLVILALSPLLKTLTEATTSDSIAALSTTLFVLSFVLADFGGSGTELERRAERSVRRRSMSNSIAPPILAKPPLPATLSLNAALCASIVLASRLHSPIDVFSLVLVAIGLFAFLPRWLKHHVTLRTPVHWKLACFTTLTMLSISVCLLFRFSPTAALANVATTFFLSIVCPAWMKKAQGWKQARRGPWDMGVPRLRSR